MESLAVRHELWGWIRASRPACEIIPWWLLLIRFLLFPIDTLYWRLSSSRGYQPDTDTWLIDGVRWSSYAIARLPQDVGRVFLVTRNGDDLTFVRIPEFDRMAQVRLIADSNECREILKQEGQS